MENLGFDIARGVNVKVDQSDATGRSVSSSGSSKGHAVYPVCLSGGGKCTFDFKITKDM